MFLFLLGLNAQLCDEAESQARSVQGFAGGNGSYNEKEADLRERSMGPLLVYMF